MEVVSMNVRRILKLAAAVVGIAAIVLYAVGGRAAVEQVAERIRRAMKRLKWKLIAWKIRRSV
jgi:hypothetical protein